MMTTITFFNQLTAMPKRLAMLLTVLFTVGVGSMYSETATVTFSDLYNANTTVDGTDISVVDGITLTFNKRSGGTATQYYTSGSAMRWYGGGTLDVASTIGNITAITITYTQTANSVSSNVGTYTLSSKTGSWTGDATAIKFTQSGTSGHCRISKIEVTYTSSGGGNTGGDSGDDGGDSGDVSGGECTWQLVTDASTLKVGDEIVIAASNANYALSTTQNSNNRSATAITKSNNTITFNEAVQIITLAQGSTTGTLSFFVGSGYLYAASSSKNYMRTQTTPGTNGDWIIGINNGVATIQAQGDYTNNVIRYNPNSGNPIFACYASTSTTGSLPAIYKKVCTTEPTVFVIPKCGGDGGGTWLVVIGWFATF